MSQIIASFSNIKLELNILERCSVISDGANMRVMLMWHMIGKNNKKIIIKRVFAQDFLAKN